MFPGLPVRPPVVRFHHAGHTSAFFLTVVCTQPHGGMVGQRYEEDGVESLTTSTVFIEFSNLSSA